MRCCQSLLRSYSVFLFKYPFVFLILTPAVLILCAVLSFVPGVGPELPEFSKPTKGFEARGTPIMKRVVTNVETFQAALTEGSLSRDPRQRSGNISSTRKKRSLHSGSLNLCPFDAHYVAAKTVYEAGGADMMNLNSLKTVCKMEETVLRLTQGFEDICQPVNQTAPPCCPSLSLGNYIASIRNRSSCQHITTDDVTFMTGLLRNCSSLYLSGKLANVPANPSQAYHECYDHKERLKIVFKYLVDKEYLTSSDTLTNTMVITPVNWHHMYFSDVYNAHLKSSVPEENGVKLVAFDFYGFKFDQFSNQLVSDAVFLAVGLLFVAVILWVYTYSAFVMFLTVFSVITSVIISYFLYHHVFRLTFFPFLNVTTFVFLVGIGADDAFVFTDVWKQAKLGNPRGTMVDWMEYTLKHAALSMFVTSFTTSSAFYANIVSDVTAIRLFGIYAGTAILIKYALMITWFPAGVIFLEKWFPQPLDLNYTNPEMNQISLENLPKDVAIVSPNSPPLPEESPAQHSDYGNSSQVILPKPSSESADVDQQVHSSCGRVGAINRALRSKCSRLMSVLFGKGIPRCLSLFPLWLLALLALGIGMLCAVTVSPGLQRPKSNDFQLFSSSHILEQYDLKYKEKFRGDSQEEDSQEDNIFWVSLFLGIKAEDNGNYLDPSNFGHLVYDTSFNITSPKAQQWLVDLCSHIRQQTYFGNNTSWSCLPEEFAKACSTTTNQTLPFPLKSLSKCIQDFSQSSCSSCSDLFFDKHGNLKVLRIRFPTNVPYGNQYKTLDRLWESMKVLSSDVLDKAPPGVQNGWTITWLRFYALQKNLGTSTITSLGVSLAISFAVMLFTSMNWVISVYAITTIICILSTTIGSLVLAGWELNILESIVMSVAVGLSVDFTLHYGVAYTISTENDRRDQVKYALSHIGPAVTLASITTFIAGVFMMFSTVLVYFQLGQFLALVMAVSWVYATFFFMSLCYFAGPVGHFGQINSKKCLSCKISTGAANMQENFD